MLWRQLKAEPQVMQHRLEHDDIHLSGNRLLRETKNQTMTSKPRNVPNLHFCVLLPLYYTMLHSTNSVYILSSNSKQNGCCRKLLSTKSAMLKKSDLRMWQDYTCLLPRDMCIQTIPDGQSASQNGLVWFYSIYHYSFWQTQCHWFPEELQGCTAEDKQFTGTLPHWTALSACQEPSILNNTCFSHWATHFFNTITLTMHGTIWNVADYLK